MRGPAIVSRALKIFVNTISRYKMFSPGSRIAVAVSGGKDSSTMLYLLTKFGEKYNWHITPIHVLLGKEDFFAKEKNAFIKLCKKLNLKGYIVDASDILEKILKIARGLRRCTVCSYIRRYSALYAALKLNTEWLAVGTTLEDCIRNILSYLVDGNVFTATRMYPVQRSIVGIKIARPIMFLSEEEIKKIALCFKVPHIDLVCPYSEKSESSITEATLKMIEVLGVDRCRKFVHNFVENVLPSIKHNITLRKCKSCGMPTMKEKCFLCRTLKEEVKLKLEEIEV